MAGNYWKPEYNHKRLEVRRQQRIQKHMKKMQRFSTINKMALSYTAGLVDGEGCILININKAKRSYTLQVRIGMATVQAIKWLHKTFRGSLGMCNAKNHTSMHIWVISSAEAEGFLKCLLPYLKVKKEEAKVALAFRKHLNSTRRFGKILPIEVIAKREAYRIKLQEMKRNEK